MQEASAKTCVLAASLKTQAEENACHLVSFALDDDPRNRSHPQQGGVHVAFFSTIDCCGFRWFFVSFRISSMQLLMLFYRLNSFFAKTSQELPLTCQFLQSSQPWPCIFCQNNFIFARAIFSVDGFNHNPTSTPVLAFHSSSVSLFPGSSNDQPPGCAS